MNDYRYSKLVLFEPVKDVYGSRLALVFGNEATDGKCPFYLAKQCNHCDIGGGEGIWFDTPLNKARLEFMQHYYGNKLKEIEHLIVYNSGSVLNRHEMSIETLTCILNYIQTLDKCKIVSFDSRETFINYETIGFIISHLRLDQQMRVVLGVESQDDNTRIVKLNKKMTKENIEKVFQVISEYSDKRVGIDFNVLFQPPELIREAAIEESLNTVKYGLDLGQKYKVPIDFNFHPYYPSHKSSLMYPRHPRAIFEDIILAIKKMSEEIVNRKMRSMIFIGWQDEGHDVDQTTRNHELRRQVYLLNKFNLEQHL